MPADGISLPPKRGTSARPAGAARRLGYINHATPGYGFIWGRSRRGRRPPGLGWRDMLRRAGADVVSATDPQARFSKPSFGEMKRGRLRRARGRRRGRAHHESHRCAGRIAVVLDARLRLSLRPQANPRICSDTRGRHGRIREELAAGIIEKPRRQGVDASLPPAESLPAPKNFFAKTSFTQRLPPLWAEPFLDRFLSEGA